MESLYTTPQLLDCFAVSLDGRRVAGSTESMVFVLDLESGSPIFEHRYAEDEADAETIAFDRTGRFFVDNRWFLQVVAGWDRPHLEIAEFCRDDQPGFVLDDSNATGALLVSHPVGNRVFYVTADLKEHRIVTRFRCGSDFAGIAAYFIADDRLLVQVGKRFFIGSFPTAGEIAVPPASKLEPGKILAVAGDRFAYYREGELVVASERGDQVLSLPPETRFWRIWLRPDLAICAVEVGDRVVLYDIAAGRAVASRQIAVSDVAVRGEDLIAVRDCEIVRFSTTAWAA